ncbi:MAG: hypothetical protein ACYTEZ_00620 [Planctomycetota bacterium]|jgi:tetratricopeptide (TPR) repeat protein
MLRPALVLLLLAALCSAQGRYERLLQEAQRIFLDARPGNPIPMRLDAEYAKLAEAVRADPDRWEAYFERGLNRCRVVFFMRGIAANKAARLRAQGKTAEFILDLERHTTEWLRERLREGHHDFSRMEVWMRQRGEFDADRIRFASACMKFAAREYEQAQRGQPGAIADFKELIKRNFLPERCADHIALAYLDLGAEAFREDDYLRAQRHWDAALTWARQPALRRMIYTNKAGAYESDNEYGLAEKLLREQIEREPHRPIHHKNLGLVLGYQNRLKEALHHYGRARELCRRTRGSLPLILRHGNAWLRAAMIHGKLLTEDGDARLAWRLFLEYRSVFGDDYNFSLWFGDFAASLGQYDLAWRYLEHARDLQPLCTVAYHQLLQIAPRTRGSAEEVRQRIETAKAAFEAARARYVAKQEMPDVKRVCGGLGDIGDLGTQPDRAPLLDPDPLAGHDAANPPTWLAKVAASRRPFEPWRPPATQEAAEGAAADAAGESARPRPWLQVVSVAVAVLVLGALGFLFFRRRRAPAA